MRSYNTTVHSGISCTPMERYRNTKDHPRIPESREWLDNCFFNRITRKVRKDPTVSIDKVSYDCPMQFISSPVEIRFLPDDMDSAFILYDMKGTVSRSVRPINMKTVTPGVTMGLHLTMQRSEDDHGL